MEALDLLLVLCGRGQNQLVWVVVVLVDEGKTLLLLQLDHSLRLPPGPLPHAADGRRRRKVEYTSD